jgi:hypothetical protein
MAALTATSVITSNAGTSTLLTVALTAQGTSDTWTMYAGAPILGAWINSANPGTQVSFVQSTGVFTIINSSGTAAENLYVLLGGC